MRKILAYFPRRNHSQDRCMPLKKGKTKRAKISPRSEDDNNSNDFYIEKRDN